MEGPYPDPLLRQGLTMYYAGRHVLITGGLGFIGSNLARRLVALGAQVTLVDNLSTNGGGNLFNIQDIERDLRVDQVDIRDRAAMSGLLRNQEVLFNLAGQTGHLASMKDPHNDLAVNADAQLSILESCRRFNSDIRIVYASTRQVYGRPDYLPIDEAHPARPLDVNGICKIAGEGFHMLYHRVFGIHACVLRMTNTYGPGMRVKDAQQTFLGLWVRQAIEGDTIKVFGDGRQLRDLNYVDDVVEALVLAGENPAAGGKTYNLGGNQVLSLDAIARQLTALCPSACYELAPFPPELQNIDIGDYFGDFSAIGRDLHWAPRVRLDHGLRLTLEYYRAHGSLYLDAAS